MQMVGRSQPGAFLSASGLSVADCLRVASRLFTIGHSKHEFGRFLQLLRNAGGTVVADVRSSPFSRRLPHLNQRELCAALEREGIGYLFLGDQLGGRPHDLNLYDVEGRVDYWRVRRSESFRAGLDRLLCSFEQHIIAIMCAEEDPLDCHRGLMISAELVEQGICPRHLRGDGSTETTLQFEDRLLRSSDVCQGIPDGVLAIAIAPEERASLLAEAYRTQARRHAFRLPPGHSAGAIDGVEEFASE